MLLALVTVHSTTRTQDLATLLLDWFLTTTPVVCELYLVLFTTVQHILDILVKIGDQVLTGHVCLGRIQLEMFQATRQLHQTTAGILTQQRLFFQYLMKDQRMATPLSRLTIQLRLTKHTTTVWRPA